MIPEVGGGLDLGAPRKGVPKCLKWPKTTYTTIEIAEKYSKISKKGSFVLYIGPPGFHPGNGIDGARRGRSLPVPPPGFSSHGSALASWNQEHLSDQLSQEGIEWHFNTPAAPHMGGIWERMVASVKRALQAVLGRVIVSEETLRTVVVEVESVVNSRPLTHGSFHVKSPKKVPF